VEGRANTSHKCFQLIGVTLTPKIMVGLSDPSSGHILEILDVKDESLSRVCFALQEVDCDEPCGVINDDHQVLGTVWVCTWMERASKIRMDDLTRLTASLRATDAERFARGFRQSARITPLDVSKFRCKLRLPGVECSLERSSSQVAKDVVHVDEEDVESSLNPNFM
jgi:hypothetical protein